MKRSIHRLLLVTISLAAAGCGAAPMLPGATVREGASSAQAVKGELIVKFKGEQGRQALLQKLGLRTVKQVSKIGAVVVKTASPDTALAALKANPEVLYAEPNYIARLVNPKDAENAPDLEGALQVNDPMAKKQWAIKKIDAPGAWAVTRGQSEVKLAIVDTGIDYRHPDLAGRVDKGRDFINNDDDAMDDNMHGTHCAGIAAASTNNGIGIAGLAPEVSLLAVKVLAGSGSGSYEGVANGIIYAADRGSHVISLSLGGPAGSKVIEEAVAYARGKGALVLAAMGNEMTSAPSYPAAAPGVMAVGATTWLDWKAIYSNTGAHISVAAPGSGILSTVPGGGYHKTSGTSMATPYVAGLAALVKSKYPDFTADQIRQKIEATADDLGGKGFDHKFGHGRINARRALTE